MKQYAKKFDSCYRNCVEDQLNEFLRVHPNYTVNNISYANIDYRDEFLFVVFNVDEE